MRMRLDFDFNVMRLYNGRRSVWLSVTVGPWRWWLSRWDSVRVDAKPGQWVFCRGPVMTWYGGLSR